MRRLPTHPSRDDAGVALIVALVVALLVFVLTTAILADAFHNVVGSANGRERLTAINAAEAGVSWYVHALESTNVSALRTAPTWSGSLNTWTSAPKTLAGMPGTGSFSVQAVYWRSYDAATDAFSGNPCLAVCTSFADMESATAPASMWVEVRATGQAGTVSRVVRAVLEVRPVHSGLSGAFAGIFICELGNRFTITGPSADLYLVGQAGGGCPNNELKVSSGQFTTSGNVYVLSGDAILQRTTKIDGNLWAKGVITLGSGAGGEANATSCSSSSPASVLICGDATSLTSVPATGPTAKVLGTKSACSGCTLPDLQFSEVTLAKAKESFPTPTWTHSTQSAAWAEAAGTTLFKDNGAQSATLLEITCPSPSARIKMPKGTLYLGGNLAIVSSCGLEFGGRVEFRKSPSANLTTAPSLYLMTGYTATSCTVGANPRAANDYRDIIFNQNFDSTAIKLYVYSPCKLIFTNQTNITGQVVARQLYAQGRTTINTVNLLGVSGGAPGPVTSFSARILSLREV